NGRPTANLERLDRTSVEEEAQDILARLKRAHLLYRPLSFWENQKYYVQIGVEKMGIYSLFEKPTAEFRVPLINLGGWSDMKRRAGAMRRFAYWEARGKICVLLIFTDHDPGGLHIAGFVRENLVALADAVGWFPDNLIISRFGLDAKFIRRH